MDADPDGDRRGPVRASRGRRSTSWTPRSRPTSTSGPSPPASSGRSSTSTGRRPMPRCCSSRSSRPATDGGLFLPVGEPITVDLRSEDVIHAFYVPKFLFKRDVVPGKNNTFDFTIDDAGTYRGQCAELCGSGHAAMLFDVHAVDKADLRRLAAEADRPGERDAAAAAVRPALGWPAPSGGPAPRAPSARPSTSPPRTSPTRRTRCRRPPSQPFTINFNNEDTGVPHNVAIHRRLRPGDVQGRHHHRSRARRPTPSRRSRRAPTSSSARSIRT